MSWTLHPDRSRDRIEMSDNSRLAISESNIDIWLTFYHDIDNARLLTDLRAILSDAERLQEERFYFADDRRRYLITRAMVRTVLSRYATVAPADWVFSVNAYGRPEITNHHAEVLGLSFNLSHTRGLIALGVSRNRALGVDVEDVQARQVSIDIAERFFSPTEAAELASVPSDQRQDRFFEYWTFKESYIKARGMGLSIPLDRFSIHYTHDHGVKIAIDPELNDDNNRWSFWQYRPTLKYLLAICAERLDGAAPILTFRRTTPMVSDEALEATLLKTSEQPGG